MNMEWITFQQLLNEVAVTAGLDPDSGQVTPAYAAQVARAATEATRFVWQAFPWPQVCQSVPDLDWMEPGYKLLNVFSEDPEAAWVAEEEPAVVPFMISTAGAVVLQGDAPDTPFYYCQLPCPQFEAAAVVSATSYRTGRVVYDATTGDCWKYTGAAPALGSTLATYEGTTWVNGDVYNDGEAVLSIGRTFICSYTHIAAEATEPGLGADWLTVWAIAPWQPQRLPRFLVEPVMLGIEAWMLRTEGQYTSRERMQKAMENWIADEVIDLVHGRRQTQHGAPLARQH